VTAQIADFRSDTVTRPTEAMRRAMAEAPVGDDVFGDDPTVIELERESARLFGKEAALFVPSGTMANLIAFLVWCRPGEEAIVEERSHSISSEQGGAARFGGVQLRPLPSDRGALDPALVARSIKGGKDASPVERLHNAKTTLVSIENTHNFWGGRVVPLANVREVARVAYERGVRVHMDGARIFNAVVASGVPPHDWATHCDSLTFCVSKGLSAPVGSVLVGAQSFVDEARRARKALGGGMRQAGVLAACGLVALRDMVARLAEDHANAKALAEGLARVPGVEIDPGAVETNIVIFKLRGGVEAQGALAQKLRIRGVWCSPLGALGIRFVTHREVGRGDVDRALEAVRDALR
jgi:threonine aldolase